MPPNVCSTKVLSKVSTTLQRARAAQVLVMKLVDGARGAAFVALIARVGDRQRDAIAEASPGPAPRARSSVTDGSSTPVSLAMLLELRTLEQRLAHEIDLRIDILIRRESLQRGLQRRARVDEYPRLGFISVGQREHHRPADQRDGECRSQREPAKAPGAAHFVENMFDFRCHESR